MCFGVFWAFYEVFGMVSWVFGKAAWFILFRGAGGGAVSVSASGDARGHGRARTAFWNGKMEDENHTAHG